MLNERKAYCAQNAVFILVKSKCIILIYDKSINKAPNF